MIKIRLSRKHEASEEFSGTPDSAITPGWYFAAFWVMNKTTSNLWLGSVKFLTGDGSAGCHDFNMVKPAGNFLGGLKVATFFLLSPSRRCDIRLTGLASLPHTFSLILIPLPQAIAPFGVWLQNSHRFHLAMKEAAGSWRQRLRRAVATAATYGQEVPQSYKNWCALFDSWTEQRLSIFAVSEETSLKVAAVVFSSSNQSEALDATLHSISLQLAPAAAIFVSQPSNDHNVDLGGEKYDWVLLLQAGETLPPHAISLMTKTAIEHDDLDAIYADEDQLDSNGIRIEPIFKPQPSLTFMCSGLLATGVWMIRSNLLETSFAWAACARLSAWFTLYLAGKTGSVYRLPFILTHTRSDVECAPATELAAVVNKGLLAANVHATVLPPFPLRLQWQIRSAGNAKVSIVIPSRLKGEIQVSCISDVIQNTNYDNFEILIVVTQKDDFDADQAKHAEDFCSDRRVTVMQIRNDSFNYSIANNFAASNSEGEFLCLLNDDVSILSPDWLSRMVSMFTERDTAVVGAKLYYPNMTTQHGGVIMGLAGVAQHAHRFLPRGRPGYHWRGVLDQGASCVTGACLLTRRSVYNEVGGLDETFPTAFNDVDFCVKVRSLGKGIVFAGSVEMVHHETISFGHHYKSNPEREVVDSTTVKIRWNQLYTQDPYHNPNLSLVDGNEWDLAFPPRCS